MKLLKSSIWIDSKARVGKVLFFFKIQKCRTNTIFTKSILIYFIQRKNIIYFKLTSSKFDSKLFFKENEKKLLILYFFCLNELLMEYFENQNVKIIFIDCKKKAHSLV